MGQEMGRSPHEPDPHRERGESEQRGAEPRDGQHGERRGEAGTDEGADPQARVRSPPREQRRDEPAQNDEEMREPAWHGAPAPRRPYRLRASATTASAASAMVKPAPASAGRTSPRSSRATRATATRTTAPTSTGVTARGSEVSPRTARCALTMPPVQARNVPSIHQIGRYHHVLPPPMASQVQGYALNGRSRTMSIAMKTTVPHNPIAAAPAMPSTWRAWVSRAGRKLTAVPVASTISASSARCGSTAVTCRETIRNATTAAAVSKPIWVPPTMTVRMSERSDAVAVAVADMLPQFFEAERSPPQSKPTASAGKHRQHGEIRHRPGGQGPIHRALVLGRGPSGVARVPRRQHHEPRYEGNGEQAAPTPDLQPGGGPRQQRKRRQHARDRDCQTREGAEPQRRGAG